MRSDDVLPAQSFNGHTVHTRTWLMDGPNGVSVVQLDKKRGGRGMYNVSHPFVQLGFVIFFFMSSKDLLGQ